MRRTAAALIATGLLAAWNVHAQQAAPAPAPAAAPAPSAADTVRQAIRGDRRALVEKYLQLTPEEGKKFGPVYDAYAKELEKIVARQNRAVLDYVNAESSMTDGNAKRLAQEALAVDVDEAALRQKTFKKVAGVLPAKKAVRFVQIENKIRTVQRYDIAEQMPLVK